MAGHVVKLIVGAAQAKQHAVITEDPDNPCAIVSVAMVSRILGRPLSLAQAKQAVHPDGLRRASMAQLAHALDSFGFSTVGVRLTRGAVERLPVPAILHVDKSHFVTCRPNRDKLLVIYDPPDRPIITDAETLAERWNGVALLVGLDNDAMEDAVATLGISK
jgi:ABC-type bacteriocin/lantibiotic exporter with double-glycine peptidase domain